MSENKDPVTKEVCELQNRALEFRMAQVEEDMRSMDETLETNLERIYDKLEQFGKRPSWSTLMIITTLSSVSLTMLGIILKWGH